MNTLVTKELILKAISIASSKIESGKQKKKVYGSNQNENQYLINNIVGALGELVFEKALKENFYKVDKPSSVFPTFKNADTCDFFTSKTGKTIDVKTVFKENADSLIVNKGISTWREVDFYSLVKLYSSTPIRELKDVFSFTEGRILGVIDFISLSKKENENLMYGDPVYFLNHKHMNSPKEFARRELLETDEKIENYEAMGEVMIHAASFEEGPVEEAEENELIKQMISFVSKKKPKNYYNFNFISLEGELILCFPIENKIFYSSLFLKTLKKAAVLARNTNKKIVIPNYIKSLITDELDMIEMKKQIKELNCIVQCDWV